jgi:hypothetical protein
MSQRLGWLRDPSLHLIALTTALMGVFLALNSGVIGRFATRANAHPLGCRACSVCPPEVVSARDAYLIQTGSIEPSESSE